MTAPAGVMVRPRQSPFITGPGMTPIQIDPNLLGSGASAQAALQTEWNGLTPEADALLQEQVQRLQLENQEKRRKALRGMFGEDFPLAKDGEPVESDWERWALTRWEKHRAGVAQNILWAERNRLFRAGQQMISPYGSNGVWRPAPQPKDAVRIIDNRLRPSLAWALEVMAEQRPGWRFEPTNTDPDRVQKAEAQQRAVEYQYNQQDMRHLMQEAMYWAQTDGVSFLMTYWDPERGPWEELEQGAGPVPIGDCATRVYRIEQVRVSAEATANIPPMYWLIREILPKQQAIQLYGPDILEAGDQQLLANQVTQLSSVNQYAYTPLLQDQSTIARYTVFCDKSQWLPQGLTVVIVGKKLMYGPKGLLMGRVPMVRMTDGSEDPQFFPTPRMNTLIAPQMRINQLWSKWYESIRKNSGGRYATKTGSVSAETVIGGEVSMLEVRTSGDIRESILPVAGFSVAPDIKEALQAEIKIIEDQTGYNDRARGQFAEDTSGKSVLAQREMLERTFAPMVGAASHAATEWAKQEVGWMRFGYQMPRTVAIIGKDRSDLAVALSARALDGVVDISVDEETLVPQPKALRQWMLDNAFDRQLISKEQWLERSPIGDVQDMDSPDRTQLEKAKRVVEQIRLGQPQEPIVPQDNEPIQMAVIERELILAGGIQPQILQAAQQRWAALKQQFTQKQTPPPPAPGSPEALWQRFITDIGTQAENKAKQLIAQAIEAADFANAQANAVGIRGPTQPAPPVPGQRPKRPIVPGQTPVVPLPKAPQRPQPRHSSPLRHSSGKPRVGKPEDAHVAPLASSTMPSVAVAPVQ